MLMGHYMATRKGFPLTFMPENSFHFVGVHECLCMTVRHPRYVKDMLEQAHDLPLIKPFGQIVWLGAVNVGPPTKVIRARRVYIPSTIWNPPASMKGRRLRTNAIVRPVTDCIKKRFKYQVMEFPAFHRDGILGKYIIEE